MRAGDQVRPDDQEPDSHRSQDANSKSFRSLTFGPRLVKSFNQPKQRTEIKSVRREFTFPKYHFNVIIKILFCKKFNVYFGLAKDYTLRVYNKDFEETERAASESRNLVTHLLFNPVLNELITGGACVRYWSYQQMETDKCKTFVSMSNYGLVLRQEFELAEGRWCTRMQLDVARQWLYCFSDLSLLCYDMTGRLVSWLRSGHRGMVLASIFSPYSRMLLTAAVDFQIRAWSETGQLLHVFQGHNRPVTSLVLHPDTASLFISASLDGTIRLWCLDTLSLLFSITCMEGVLGLGLTEERLLYSWSLRSMQLYHLNHFLDFWGHLRSPALSFTLCRAPGKTTRLLTLGDGNSLHIFSCADGKKLCMMPPHPFLSPLEVLPSFAYDRANGVILLLLSSWEIWIYTARTDPAGRVAVLDIHEGEGGGKLVQIRHTNSGPVGGGVTVEGLTGFTSEEYMRSLCRTDPACRVAVLDIRELQQLTGQGKRQHRLLLERAKVSNVSAKRSVSWECCSLGFLNSPVCYHTDEGPVCADTTSFMLCGMMDGRILFMDVAVRYLKYCELKAHKDPVVWLGHAVEQEQLMTVCAQPAGRLLQVWSLPMLEALHHVPVPSDSTVFTWMDKLLFLGFHCGSVKLLSFLQQGDTRGDGPVENSDSKHSHRGAVLSVDASTHLHLFLSCGSDGLVKLWDRQCALLAEVQLDASLSAACFLSPQGDLLLGFRLHLFKLSHRHLVPSSLSTPVPLQISLTESFIYENPCMMFDHKRSRKQTEPVNMENYIEPYKGFDFTSEFTLPPLEVPYLSEDNDEELQSSVDDEVHHVPSLTYQSLPSPASSLSALSFRVLLLTPGHSATDLSQILALECPVTCQSPPPANSASEIVQSEGPEPWDIHIEFPSEWTIQLEDLESKSPPTLELEDPSLATALETSPYLQPVAKERSPPPLVENTDQSNVKEPTFSSRFANIRVTIPAIKPPVKKVVSPPPQTIEPKKQPSDSPSGLSIPRVATPAAPEQVTRKRRQAAARPGTSQAKAKAAAAQAKARERTTNPARLAQKPQRKSSGHRTGARGQRVADVSAEEEEGKKKKAAPVSQTKMEHAVGPITNPTHSSTASPALSCTPRFSTTRHTGSIETGLPSHPMPSKDFRLEERQPHGETEEDNETKAERVEGAEPPVMLHHMERLSDKETLPSRGESVTVETLPSRGESVTVETLPSRGESVTVETQPFRGVGVTVAKEQTDDTPVQGELNREYEEEERKEEMSDMGHEEGSKREKQDHDGGQEVSERREEEEESYGRALGRGESVDKGAEEELKAEDERDGTREEEGTCEEEECNNNPDGKSETDGHVDESEDGEIRREGYYDETYHSEEEEMRGLRVDINYTRVPFVPDTDTFLSHSQQQLAYREEPSVSSGSSRSQSEECVQIPRIAASSGLNQLTAAGCRSSSTLVKGDRSSLKDVTVDASPTKSRKHSALRQLQDTAHSWIEKEILRHEYLQRVQRERMLRARETRGELELQRVQQWASQPHHAHCSSAQAGSHGMLPSDPPGPPRCDFGRSLRTCPSIQHPPEVPQNQQPPPSHAPPPLAGALPAQLPHRAVPQAWLSAREQEQPYRLQMTPLSRPLATQPRPVPSDDVWDDSTRRVHLLRRPFTGTSIPSKGRYVLSRIHPSLVKHPPSQLEERLLRERFPRLRRALPAKASTLHTLTTRPHSP